MKTRKVVAIASLIVSLITGTGGVGFAAGGNPGIPDVDVSVKSCCSYMAACSGQDSASQKAVIEKFEKEKAEAVNPAR